MSLGFKYHPFFAMNSNTDKEGFLSQHWKGVVLILQKRPMRKVCCNTSYSVLVEFTKIYTKIYSDDSGLRILVCKT